MSIKDWTSKVKGVEKSDVVWGGGGGVGAGRGLENYKIFLDIICVTSLAYRGHRACLFLEYKNLKLPTELAYPAKETFLTC